MTYQTEGIILSRTNYRDADRLIRLLTPDQGLLTLRAISVRRPRAKLIGHTEPLVYTAVFVARSRGIDILAGSQTIHPFVNLRQSVPACSIAHLIVNVIDRAVAASDPHPELFDELLQYLYWLNSNPPHALLVPGMLLRIAGHTGYQPQFDSCLQCRRPLEPVDQFFQCDAWSVLCAICATTAQTPATIALPVSILKVLRLLLRIPWSELTAIQLPVEQRTDLYRFFYRLLTYHNPLDAQALGHHYTLVYPISTTT